MTKLVSSEEMCSLQDFHDFSLPTQSFVVSKMCNKYLKYKRICMIKHSFIQEQSTRKLLDRCSMYSVLLSLIAKLVTNMMKSKSIIRRLTMQTNGCSVHGNRPRSVFHSLRKERKSPAAFKVKSRARTSSCSI